MQRIAEGQNLDIRLFLRKCESVIEGQRLDMRERRDAVLHGQTAGDAAERQVRLEVIDELWADYLAAVAELRAGTPWLSVGGRDPLRTFLAEVHAMFTQLTATIDEEVAVRMAEAPAGGSLLRQRGATWTYLTTDEPFGPMTQRIMRSVVRMIRGRCSR